MSLWLIPQKLASDTEKAASNFQHPGETHSSEAHPASKVKTQTTFWFSISNIYKIWIRFCKSTSPLSLGLLIYNVFTIPNDWAKLKLLLRQMTVRNCTWYCALSKCIVDTVEASHSRCGSFSWPHLFVGWHFVGVFRSFGSGPTCNITSSLQYTFNINVESRIQCPNIIRLTSAPTGDVSIEHA